MKRMGYCLLFASLALLNSCLGASADIVMRANGSGSIALEYRVSQMLESIGRLDGNENWPAIPVGRTDFERSAARIPGLRLSSFSAKEAPNAAGGKDLVSKARLDFKDISALLSFLDSAGSRATFAREGGKNTLRLVMLDPSTDAIDADLLSLLKEVSAGYVMSVRFTAPKNASLSCFPPVPSARLVTQGKKVSFSIDAGETISLRDGLVLEIYW